MQLHHEFIKRAKENLKKTAIIDKTTDRTLTFADTLLASLILSRKLKRYRDGFLGIMLPNSAGSILSVIATLMSGKVPVVINYSTGAPENCEYAQNKCGFKTIITSRVFMEKLRCRLIKGMIFIEDIMDEITVADKVAGLLQSKMPINLLLKSVYSGEPDDNAVILFTSGSEKNPKAVQLTHNNFLSNIKSLIDTVKPSRNEIFLGVLPLFHVFGHNVSLWLPLTNGMPTVTYANPLDYTRVARIIKEEKVTVAIATPIFLAGYLRKSEPGDFDSVWLTIPGADQTPESLRRSYMEKHGIELFEGYGTTETSPVISVNTPGANKPGSVGRPLKDVSVRIADIKTGETLRPGQQGKIMVKGDLVMKGYFDDIEETLLRVKDGWYDTGDMGVIDEDGFLWHKGRLKRFVKIGGEMVSLVNVEFNLEKILPDDTDCCVVEVPDSVKGAKIIAALSCEVKEKKILKQLAKVLPPIAMPKGFMFFEDLPKMGSGKTDFRKVREMVKERINSQP